MYKRYLGFQYITLSRGFSSKTLCYDSMLTVLSKELTLVLSDTRELDRVPSTKYSTLYTNPHGLC